jgi:shikimate 5-dehydrogenase
VYGLIKRGARVTVYARDPVKAGRLGERFSVRVLPLDSFSSSDAQVVINTTPVGLLGHSEDLSPVPGESLRGRRIAYDLVYNPLHTQFLIGARAEGCRTISGAEMLLAQAALQFELWTGQEAPIDVMRQAVMERLTTEVFGKR